MAINLYNHEWCWRSQHGEDGVIEKIVECIPSLPHTFLEIGAHFLEANCLKLSSHLNWHGIYLDDFHEFHPLGFYKEWVTAENINNIWEKYKVIYANGLGILSIDIDGMDFYIWSALSNAVRPYLVIVEVTSDLGLDVDAVVPYNPSYRWDGTQYMGCSAKAWINLANHKGYTLVYIEKSGTNMFFIRNDILQPDMFVNAGNLEELWKQITPSGHPIDPQKRPFFTSDEAIRYNTSKYNIVTSVL